MQQHALVVGVEAYQDPSISTVQFAEADATAVRDALVALGFTVELLLSSRATKSTIESFARRIAGAASNGDVFFIFYAGHGFAKNGLNYLTCGDTLLSDLQDTSIELRALFEQLEASQASRRALFLDACESGLPAASSVRSIYTDLDSAALSKFFGNAESCVCFSSCRPPQSSFSDTSLGHGIWTFHLLEALTGRAEQAGEKGLVTAMTLQNFLADVVPRSVRRLRSSSLDRQTPWAAGGLSKDFLVADLRAKLKKGSKLARNQSVSLTLSSVRSAAVRSLSGFQKVHRVPDRVSGTTNAFVARCAAAELKAEIDDVYELLKSELAYKRADLKVDGDVGVASVEAPDLTYSISVRLASDDPTTVLWERQLYRVADEAKLRDPRLAAVMAGRLNVLEAELRQPLNLSAIVDILERDPPEGIDPPEYNSDFESVGLSFEGLSAQVVLLERSIRLEHGKSSQPPAALVDEWRQVRQLLSKHGIVHGL